EKLFNFAVSHPCTRRIVRIRNDKRRRAELTNKLCNLTWTKMETIFASAVNEAQRRFELFRKVRPTAEGWYVRHNWRLRRLAKPRNDLGGSVARHDRIGTQARDLFEMLLMDHRVVGVIPQNVGKIVVDQLQHFRRREVKIYRYTEIKQLSWRSNCLLDRKERWIV